MAVGDIGMSIDDFCRCTPAEFRAVADAWNKNKERMERSGWSRARLLATVILQPYSESPLGPQDVMIFPWEKEGQEEKLTTDEIWKRFEEVKIEQGLQ